jgi:hypothetical protein
MNYLIGTLYVWIFIIHAAARAYLAFNQKKGVRRRERERKGEE